MIIDDVMESSMGLIEGELFVWSTIFMEESRGS